MEALRFGGQMGYPPNVTTDARRGYSVVANQSGAILFGSREGDSRILVRIVGTCTRARPRGRGDLAHRATVGYCPCCTRPTQIAAPSRNGDGAFIPEQARGRSP